MSVFGKSSAGVTTDDLKRADFPANTQRLGIRFTEKIRDVFRHKWLRVTHRAPRREESRAEESRHL